MKLRMMCARCNAALDYPSWHCDDCVTTHRVCRMCDNNLSSLRSHAEFCSPDHRAAAGYQKKKKSPRQNVENVENVDIGAMLASVLAGIETIKGDIQKLKQGRAIVGTTDHNDLLGSIEVTQAEYEGNATEIFIASLTALQNTTFDENGEIIGPRKTDAPAFAAPDENAFDDIEI